MQAPAKPAAPAPKAKPKPAPVTPKAKKAPKPAATKQPSTADKAKAAAARKKAAEAEAAERRRLQLAALGNMADAALEQSLERESVSLLRDEEAQIAQSYRAEIYELVRKVEPPAQRPQWHVGAVVGGVNPDWQVISVAVVEGSVTRHSIRRPSRPCVKPDGFPYRTIMHNLSVTSGVLFFVQPEDLLR